MEGIQKQFQFVRMRTKNVKRVIVHIFEGCYCYGAGGGGGGREGCETFFPSSLRSSNKGPLLVEKENNFIVIAFSTRSLLFSFVFLQVQSETSECDNGRDICENLQRDRTGE